MSRDGRNAGGRCVKAPKLSRGGSGSCEDGAVVAGDGDGVLFEERVATVVTELADGEKRAGSKGRENVCGTC